MLRQFIPYSFISLYRKLKRKSTHKKNAQKSTEEIFSEIYRTNQWGGKIGDFNSGGGTTDEDISTRYLSRIQEIGTSLNFNNLRAVDLGCGDMRIGSKLAHLFKSYTGVDIVKDLIEHHNECNSIPSIQFKHLNIVEDSLPEGDVCFVRQVLQHLSNDQIIKIISKLRKYQYVFITEHLPNPNRGLKLNLEKPHGPDTRLYDNSGIYLSEPPFNIDSSLMTEILEVPGHECANYHESWIKGIIVTTLYTPSPSAS